MSFSSVTSFSSSLLNVYPVYTPQIAGLIVKKIVTKVLNKYVNFVNIFFFDLASKLLKHTGINYYIIELVNGQQLIYRPLYSLGPVELKTLKAYIETNLANRFIRPSKLLAGTLIFLNQKLDGSLQLFVNYKGLNNL